jgi:hypothetical protein
MDGLHFYFYLHEIRKSTKKINLAHAPAFGTDPEAKILSHFEKSQSLFTLAPRGHVEAKRW